jgi:hypothetical protein
MYYIIDTLTNPSQPDENGPFLEIHEERVSVPGAPHWQLGQRFTASLPNIVVEGTPQLGFSGDPPDLFDGSISLMSPRLAQTLRDLGVDNIDLYPATIVYTDGTKKLNWHAFNLLGLVSAADPAASTLESFDGNNLIDTSIIGLGIDPKKAHSLLMFRLAENIMAMVVHEKIRKGIEDAGINTFAFVEPTNWVHL